jgi:hypothetical protein
VLRPSRPGYRDQVKPGNATAPEAARSETAVRWAYASIATGLIGAAFVVVGVSALDRPWSGGYVSEAGAVTSAHHAIYRAGVGLVAAALGLLGAALMTQRASASSLAATATTVTSPTGASPAATPGAMSWWPSWIPAAGIVLAAASVFGIASSRVSCTTGCPLPPYQATTVPDLIHAAASIAAVALAAVAMVSLAVSRPPGVVRWFARAGAAVCVPLLVFLAVAILAVGRGRLTAVTERVALALVLAWALATALAIARRAS